MAATSRQQKSGRKGAPEPSRRTPAWTGARASPTFTPNSGNTSRTQGTVSPASNNFPPLTQANGTRPEPVPDRNLQALSGLTGTTVTISTKTSLRYEGVVTSTSGEGDTTGVTLRDVKEISNPGAPLKEHFFIASTNIDSWTSGPADAKPPNGTGFRTDTDISQRKGAGRERELQQWSAGPDVAPPGDDDTFGPSNHNTSWDQFAVNEKLFGVKTDFDENLYTTKLDRSAADFKERERNAQRIANEIINATTNNPHIAEERNVHVDDSGVAEEDKYGAVIRGSNAYIPPGARKAVTVSPGNNNTPTVVAHSTNANASSSPPAISSSAVSGNDVPKVSINGPDGAKLPSQTQSPSSSKAPSPAPPNKPADALPAFRDFVTNEKQRLTQKRQALVKNEMDKRLSELLKFSKDFKLNKPIPDDLVPILAKDEEKQRAIREKTSKDAASTQARSIGAATPANATRGTPVANAKISGTPQRPPVTPAAVKSNTNNAVPTPPSVTVPKPVTTAKTTTSDATAKKPVMFIQAIPPFKGGKTRQQSGQTSANGNATTNTGALAGPTQGASNGSMSPVTAANRLNVNASSFRPNAKANAFTPGAVSSNSTASATVLSKPKLETTHNPFFGTRPIKKNPPVNIKEDFNPFKHNKVVDPTQVSGVWPYTGKRYAQMFPQPQPQHMHQQPHNMPNPGPPPIPPPSYEEDSAAQAAAARGYVYAYPPYGYPGQPIMPGMAPPGPPGAYMPAPYMPHIQYQPGMPPPNAMYTPGMGQMPPPQSYLPPPPPGGPYPPPNAPGPRPSVPSTPMPAHVHQYYHQSPQLQHAVPYHMIVPPPTVSQHPYEGGPAPPVQMGGHA